MTTRMKKKKEINETRARKTELAVAAERTQNNKNEKCPQTVEPLTEIHSNRAGVFLNTLKICAF